MKLIIKVNPSSTEELEAAIRMLQDQHDALTGNVRSTTTVTVKGGEQLSEAIEKAGQDIQQAASQLEVETTLQEDLDAGLEDTPPAPSTGGQGQGPANYETLRDTAAGNAPDTPPPPAAESATEVDAAGYPWDERIHGSTKKKLVKTGNWKYKRGIDKALIEEVEAELRMLTQGGVVPQAQEPTATPPPPAEEPAATPPPPAQEPEPTLYIYDGSQYTAEQLLESGWSQAQIDGLEVVQPAAPSIEWTFPAFMSAKTEAGKTDAEILEVLKRHGIESIVLLATRPDLVGTIATELGL